ncbi:UDP-N-acetylglucosamine--N-acetylmuramyl-(pentapeptide) pyrophosphoryl-undecaprenol N-acetylglucosamine transferase [Bacillus mesophilus]|uniref:UDP-N-acetylglucosamine--N-acetylmuramyl-(pentapeptide) pyrophosphoryl-undecaprenol N-acetylglucosamine transferase n=1 Tax=Bacillus mesophilus TaxID=1808955 RepID=A0A6M0QB04_9BACI|nr:undecaprenyldiphospho-muramoylpentapeptide beta-N-acetylglucosaminyltransferase [Bacillus mesophilus]MBM7661900.1 UDP-N-acetylglucosamine--N-acetylmuramyl-(pentapeptide) pyrophosphoryl-undecaprenol N-acetylglucosamine transferase [Bacillus mesophilus]NEY72740.1 undecaprenyldiphospho-muramoylpentapeptide beta-N-acetylglucosaminyltransferase [Bacillus mesophilus]
MRKRIVFTGGGSAGHVILNLALIPHFRKEGWEISYIGSVNGIERDLISKVDGVTYYPIATGKLRRYFDWKNVKDPFKVLKGTYQAYRLLRKLKPSVIFSKGGFVSVPVILAGKLNKVPSIIHESDVTPGLANKLAIPFSTKLCVTFKDTVKHIKESSKVVHTGAIVRDEIFKGSKEKGLKDFKFQQTKPVLLIMGGSLGSKKINEIVRASLQELLGFFQIVHICGKGNIKHSLHQPGYKQVEYLTDELPDVLAMTDIVISRAGSNSIFEFLALKKPMILIPLTKEQSRGDQIINAESFKKEGYAEVLQEGNLTKEGLVNKLEEVLQNKEIYLRNMEQYEGDFSVNPIISLINEVSK